MGIALRGLALLVVGLVVGSAWAHRSATSWSSFAPGDTSSSFAMAPRILIRPTPTPWTSTTSPSSASWTTRVAPTRKRSVRRSAVPRFRSGSRTPAASSVRWKRRGWSAARSRRPCSTSRKADRS